ncbi:hypothetical protein TNCV_2111561 [Trichonephila clavipes]|nr:hypothetical protein TNCV_2111561 [Trichonephila clavipes]
MPEEAEAESERITALSMGKTKQQRLLKGYMLSPQPHASNSGATAREGQCLHMCYLSFRDLGVRWVYGQMFRSRGQSHVKPPEFSSQAILVLIYRPAEGMKC